MARLFPIVDVETCRARAVQPVALIEALAADEAPRVERILLRARTLSPGETTALALDAAAACGVRRVALYVAPPSGTDLVGLIQRTGAAGVHLRAADVRLAASGGLGPKRAALPFGVSIHNPQELRAAARAGADYVFASPVRAPISKRSDAAPLGFDGLAKLLSHRTELSTELATETQLYALGGMRVRDLDRAAQVGAHGIAGINLAFELCGLESAPDL